jgi:hypothetical protein
VVERRQLGRGQSPLRKSQEIGNKGPRGRGNKLSLLAPSSPFVTSSPPQLLAVSYCHIPLIDPFSLVPSFPASQQLFAYTRVYTRRGEIKPVRTLGYFLSAILVASVLPQALRGQSGTFAVSQLGKQVGTASFKFVATSKGFDSSSTVRVSLKGLEYAFSKTEHLSDASELQHVQLSATVNGSAVNVVGVPDSAQFLLNFSANGRNSTARVDAHPAAVFMPDFDPGALETLLALAAYRNNRDLWAIIPKQSGDQPASTSQVKLATYPDEQGTLNGQPIAVHHLTATIAGATTDLFSDSDNHLLQAELPQQGFALIRSNFVLKPPAKAGAAPAPDPAQ